MCVCVRGGLPGIKRNILSLEFMGFNAFKPRCAVPLGGSRCKSVAGGSSNRALALAQRALDDSAEGSEVRV